jgi:NADPH:quinone reductase-like Zn-dependent oxidoreductase
MKAIATTDFGAPVTLVEIPAPEPREGEILVRVASSSINGFDLSVANGHLKRMMEHRFPVVRHAHLVYEGDGCRSQPR